ncbi:AAA domain-containing protein [Fusibacter ferrireducens]|uniref:AAA family ATPase n=1 Tax=Fusibacter ferrireducens TaxID=2785058 RepID=A0ABR9ZUZ6_9FIRM|nr:AAA domain-containing protein [Fusibacter ferrireducens]MBF4694253.1 AAA family ATPase [Fusibacter ferrireducens]
MQYVTNLTHLIIERSISSGEIKDKTDSIATYKKDKTGYTVKFKSSPKEYRYKDQRMKVLTDPTKIDSENQIIKVFGKQVDNIERVLDFGYRIKFFFNDGSTNIYKREFVKFEQSKFFRPEVTNLLDYFKAIAVHQKSEEYQESFLKKELDSIKNLPNEAVLTGYLTKSLITGKSSDEILVFPFGINKSQKIAVERALTHKISVIQGPPGTGKTQTILNIIANIIHQNKNVAIVSGNNSATDNVYEKLVKNDYGFLAAPLGNKSRTEQFFEQSKVASMDTSKWSQKDSQLEDLQKKALKSLKDLTVQLDLINERALLKERYSKLRLEQKYFMNEKTQVEFDIKKYILRKTWSSKDSLKFLSLLEHIDMRGGKYTLFDRAKMLVKYRFYKSDISNIVNEDLANQIHQYYYKKAIEECLDRLKEIKSKLDHGNFDKIMETYREESEILMKNAIFKRYQKKSALKFDKKTYKTNFDDFINRYPVVLSTTNSIRRNKPNNFLFDYLIIDEASQVDLVTAIIAMSSCKHIVIVGDPMQLPHIVNTEMKKINDKLVNALNIDDEFDYSKYSIIDSIQLIYGDDIPITMLKEHYRCHPQIIRFCNEKYYDNNLVIMTSENKDDKVLSLYKATPGNHEREHPSGGYINIRQIEVMKDEVLPALKSESQNIGIVTPFRQQANEAVNIISSDEILIETVHKFQGREKEVIIISTVRSRPDNFIDDKKMVNVAVSRAIKSLIVVTNHEFIAKHGSNIGDLVKYIEYTGEGANIINSKRISIFDCLYTDYAEALTPFLNKMINISEFKSENLMGTLIKDVLKEDKFRSLKCLIHFPLKYLIKSDHSLLPEEIRYAKHPFTHVDFIVFNKLNKEPILVIEVDGYEYHKEGTDQYRRDRLKDGILDHINLPIIRFSTIGSNEKEKLILALDNAMNEEA